MRKKNTTAEDNKKRMNIANIMNIYIYIYIPILLYLYYMWREWLKIKIIK